MKKTNFEKTLGFSNKALAFWHPSRNEKKAIKRRSQLDKFTQVDEIWDQLKDGKDLLQFSYFLPNSNYFFLW